MVLWHQFSSQVMEASRHYHQLGLNTDPPPTHTHDLPPSIWPSVLYKSTPDPCSTFQRLLIDFMCTALPQKKTICYKRAARFERNQPALLLNSREAYLLLDCLCCKTVGEHWLYAARDLKKVLFAFNMHCKFSLVKNTTQHKDHGHYPNAHKTQTRQECSPNELLFEKHFCFSSLRQENILVFNQPNHLVDNV